MTDHTAFPDYELDEALDLTTAEQFSAVGDPTRMRILGLLGQQAATTKQVAEALRLPKGTAGHHLKVLEAAGLIRVVRTRQVRAITEKYYGRVARTTRIGSDSGLPGMEAGKAAAEMTGFVLKQALDEIDRSAGEDAVDFFVFTHAQVPVAVAHEFSERLNALARELRERAAPGERMYGLVAGIYPTDWNNITPHPPAPSPPKGNPHRGEGES